MMNNNNTFYIDNPISSSEVIFIENVLVLFVISPFVIGLFENIYVSLVTSFSLVYIFSTLLFRKVYYYSEYLVILYPSRFVFRKRMIEYSKVKEIRYVRGSSAYSFPEIQIRFKYSIFFHFYISLNREKRIKMLNELVNLGVNVVVKSKHFNDQDILNKP